MSLHPLKFKNLIALAALGAALACGGKDSPGPDRHDHNHLLRLVVHPSVIRKGQAAHLHAEFDRGEGEVLPGHGQSYRAESPEAMRRDLEAAIGYLARL